MLLHSATLTVAVAITILFGRTHSLIVNQNITSPSGGELQIGNLTRNTAVCTESEDWRPLNTMFNRRDCNRAYKQFYDDVTNFYGYESRFFIDPDHPHPPSGGKPTYAVPMTWFSDSCAVALFTVGNAGGVIPKFDPSERYYDTSDFLTLIRAARTVVSTCTNKNTRGYIVTGHESSLVVALWGRESTIETKITGDEPPFKLTKEYPQSDSSKRR